MLARLARLSIAHRRAVILTWVALLVGAGIVVSSVGTRYATDFSLPGSESQRALDMLKRDFPAQAGDSDQIVLHARAGKVTDAAVRSSVAPMLAKVAKLPHVTSVTSPYSAAGAKAVSKDGSIAFATVNFDQRANELPDAAVKRVISTAEAARSPGLQVELGGQAIQQAQRPALGAATSVGIVAAIIILLITFGSLIAAGLPILTALLGLGTGVGVIGLASQVLDMPDVSTELAVMIGLGVGIDYSLFIVTRFREAYQARGDLHEAIVDGDGHRRARRAVRGHHRDHRPARHAHAGRQLPLRHGGGLGARRAAHDARGAHRGARAARPLRRAHRAARAPGQAQGPGGRPAGHRLGALGGARPAPSLAAPRGRPGDHARAGRPRAGACARARATPATTRPTTPRAAPTTCWPRASARASTARC